ncbi:hypothetical protein WDW89_23770 [Deltaproteobacteria bacterium TL4]
MASELIEELKDIETTEEFLGIINQKGSQLITEISLFDPIEINALVTHFKGEMEEVSQTLDFVTQLATGQFQKLDEIIKNPELPLEFINNLSEDAIQTLLNLEPLKDSRFDQAKTAIQVINTFMNIESWDDFENKVLEKIKTRTSQFWTDLESLPNQLTQGFEAVLQKEFQKRGLGEVGRKIGQVINIMDMLTDVERLPDLINQPEAFQTAIQSLTPEYYIELKDMVWQQAELKIHQGAGNQVTQMLQEVRDHEIKNWPPFFLKHSRVFLDTRIPGLDLDAVKKALTFPVLMAQMLENPGEAGRELLAQAIQYQYGITEVSAETFKDAKKTSILMAEVLLRQQPQFQKLGNKAQILTDIIEKVIDGKPEALEAAQIKVKNLFEGEIKNLAINEAAKFVPGLAPFVPFLEAVETGSEPKEIVVGVLNTLVVMSVNPTAALFFSPAIGIAADKIDAWFSERFHSMQASTPMLEAVVEKADVDAIVSDHTQEIKAEDVDGQVNPDYDQVEITYKGDPREISVRNPIEGKIVGVFRDQREIYIQSVVDGTVHHLSGLDETFFEMMMQVLENFWETGEVIPSGTVLGLAYLDPESGQGSDPTEATFRYEIEAGYILGGTEQKLLNAQEYWRDGGPHLVPTTWDDALSVMFGGKLPESIKGFNRDENKDGEVDGNIAITLRKGILTQMVNSPVNGQIHEIIKAPPAQEPALIIKSEDGTLHKLSGLDLDYAHFKQGDSIQAGKPIGWIASIDSLFGTNVTLHYEIQLGEKIGGSDYRDVTIDPSDYWEDGGKIEAALVRIDAVGEQLNENDFSGFQVQLNVDVSRELVLDMKLTNPDTTFHTIASTRLTGTSTLQITIPAAEISYEFQKPGEHYALSESFMIEIKSDLDFSSEASPVLVSLMGSSKEFTHRLTVVDTDAGLVEQSTNQFKDAVQQFGDSFTVDSNFQINQSKQHMKELLIGLKTINNDLVDEMSKSQPNPDEISRMLGEWNAYKPNLNAFYQIATNPQVSSNAYYRGYEVSHPQQLLRPLLSASQTLDQMLIRAQSCLRDGKPFPVDHTVIDTFDSLEDRTDNWEDYVQNAEVSTPAVPNSIKVPESESRWQMVMYQMLRPEAKGDLLPEITHSFHAPNAEGEMRGSVGVSYDHTHQGEANVHVPLDGRIQHVTEGSVWILANDGTVHRFSNLSSIPQDIQDKYALYQQTKNEMDRKISLGDQIGTLASGESINYEIYGLGDLDFEQFAQYYS